MAAPADATPIRASVLPRIALPMTAPTTAPLATPALAAPMILAASLAMSDGSAAPFDGCWHLVVKPSLGMPVMVTGNLG